MTTGTIDKEAGAAEARGRRLRALIVDDDINVVRCLQSLIPWGDIGYEAVEGASNGADGLGKLLSREHDVVITDLKMPVMDGAELCRRIRGASDSVAIIFLSAYEDFQTAQEALRLGVTEYILKPVDAKKIAYLTDILQALARSRQNRGLFADFIMDAALAREIQDRLKQQDYAYFEKLFDGLRDCVADSFDSVHATCGRLIDMLFDFLLESGFACKDIEKRRAAAMARLGGFGKKMDMAGFVCNIYGDVLQLARQGRPDYNKRVVEQVGAFIAERHSDPTFCTQDVADRFHFSTDYIGKLFNRYMGRTITNHLTEIRMDSASRLLRETETPINDVSVMSGYSSPSYFIRVFKKRFGMTPADYRMRTRFVADFASGDAPS